MGTLETSGIAAAVVLPQRCSRISGALQRYGTSYPFPLLCDERREVVRRYGVWHPIGVASFNTAYASCFLVESGSKLIRYAFVGATQFARIDIDAVLEALE